MLTLKAEIRKDESVKELREGRKIPAVVYGPSFEPQKVVVDYQEFRKVIRANQEHMIFQLDLDGKKVEVFVKDFTRDKVYDTYTHVDFYAVDAKKAVIVPVPVAFEGESPAMRLGALLSVVSAKVKVKALPKDIPAELKADISILKEDGDKLRVSDLKEVKGAEFMLDANAMVASAELSRAAKKAANEEDEEQTGGSMDGQTAEEAAE